MAKRSPMRACGKPISPYYGAEHKAPCGSKAAGYVLCKECLAKAIAKAPPPRPPPQIEPTHWPCGKAITAFDRRQTANQHAVNCEICCDSLDAAWP